MDRPSRNTYRAKRQFVGAKHKPSENSPDARAAEICDTRTRRSDAQVAPRISCGVGYRLYKLHLADILHCARRFEIIHNIAASILRYAARRQYKVGPVTFQTANDHAVIVETGRFHYVRIGAKRIAALHVVRI